jgi:hypothetical protein
MASADLPDAVGPAIRTGASCEMLASAMPKVDPFPKFTRIAPSHRDRLNLLAFSDILWRSPSLNT